MIKLLQATTQTVAKPFLTKCLALAGLSLFSSCGPPRFACTYVYDCAPGMCIGKASGQAGCFATEAQCTAEVSRIVVARQGTSVSTTFDRSKPCGDFDD